MGSHGHPKSRAGTEGKFNPDGTPQPFAGSTVICHIAKDSALFAELLAIHDELLQRDFACKLSLLPPDSYHMTVFDCVTDKVRETWPASLDANITIEACNAEIEKRLAALQSEEPCRFHMRLSSCDLVGPVNTLRLEVEGCNEDENRRIRVLRDRLSKATGIRAPTHDTYGFHISLAYLIDWLTEDEHAEMTRFYARWRDHIRSTLPEFETGPLEYCVFADMMRFDRRMWIG